MLHRFVILGAVAIATAVAACGDDATTACVSSELGEVCAVNDSGAINLNGRGLQVGSEVLVETTEPERSSFTLDVGQDGTLVTDEQGEVGFLSVFADTRFSFTVSATDEGGQPIQGEIAIST